MNEKEKDKYHILTYMESRKMVQMNLSAKQKQIYTDTENKCVNVKQGRRGRMNWETGTDINTLLILCIK